MKVAVTSADFRTITPHAGHTRSFLVYEVDPGGEPAAPTRLTLPKEQTFAVWDQQGPHPLDEVDVLITGSVGEPLRVLLGARGVVAVPTTRTDPLDAIRAFLDAGGIAAFEAGS